MSASVVSNARKKSRAMWSALVMEFIGMEKFSSRTKFRQSLKATCANKQWSWSWVNHKKKEVYFGASNVHESADSQLILGFQWQQNLKGRRNPGYAEAMSNIELVLKKKYNLYTFRQFEEVINKDTGRVRIINFEQDLEQRYLVKKIDGWHAYAAGDFDGIKDPWKSKEKIVYLEGSKVPISGSRIERNARARAACLEFHGTSCCICKFDFEKTFGKLGRGFVHVHHLNLISDREGRHEVCPKTDLVPVCPNCHAMIHRGGKNRSIEEVRSLVSECKEV